MKFRQGDRVKLTRHMAETMAKDLAPHNRKRKFDWSHRTGTVVRDPHYGDQITIKWDGRKSLDQWPEKALEKIYANSH